MVICNLISGLARRGKGQGTSTFMFGTPAPIENFWQRHWISHQLRVISDDAESASGEIRIAYRNVCGFFDLLWLWVTRDMYSDYPI